FRADAAGPAAPGYLRARRVGAVRVRDILDQLVGGVSKRDISDKVAAENRCPAWMRVIEIMSTGLVTVTPDQSLNDCLRLMQQNGSYHLVVVDPSGAYRGMLSVIDLVTGIGSDEKARADMLEEFIFGRIGPP